MTVNQPSQNPNKDSATAAWELEVTQAANDVQHQIDNINQSVVTSKPQVAIYSHTQDGGVQSFTPPTSGDGFVTYFNYTDALPTLPVSGLIFSAFSDEEINYEVQQYIETANRPVNPGTVSYVVNGGTWTSSGSWTKVKPTMAGVNVWTSTAQIIGSAGQTVVAKWSNPRLLYGGQIGEGTLYYTTSQASAPSAPTASGYDFVTGVFTGLTSGWQYVPITSAMGGGTTISDKHWQVSFHVEVSETSEDQIFTWGTPVGFIPIGTTLQSDNFSAGSAGWQIVRNTGNAEFNNVTARGVLDASSITTGTLNCSGITVSNLSAGSITAGNLNADRISGGTLTIGNVSVSGAFTAPNLAAGIIMSTQGGAAALGMTSSNTSSNFFTYTTANYSQFNTRILFIATGLIINGDGSDDDAPSRAASITVSGAGVSFSGSSGTVTGRRAERPFSCSGNSGNVTKNATITATLSQSGFQDSSASGNIMLVEYKVT